MECIEILEFSETNRCAAILAAKEVQRHFAPKPFRLLVNVCVTTPVFSSHFASHALNTQLNFFVRSLLSIYVCCIEQTIAQKIFFLVCIFGIMKFVRLQGEAANAHTLSVECSSK